MRFKPSISFKPYPLYYPHNPSMARVPSSQTMDRYWPVVCLELDHTEGGDGGYLPLPPFTLITPWPPVRSAVGLDSQSSMNPTGDCACKGRGLRAPRENHPQTIPHFCPASAHGKTVFHKRGLWCQEVWGPLIYAIFCFLMRAKPSGWHGVINLWLNLICSVL